jgi:transposase
LRRLEPLSPETRALRAVVRAREDMVEQRVALGNQLRAGLEAFWPGAAAISPMFARRSASPSWSATRRRSPRPA